MTELSWMTIESFIPKLKPIGLHEFKVKDQNIRNLETPENDILKAKKHQEKEERAKFHTTKIYFLNTVGFLLAGSLFAMLWCAILITQKKSHSVYL